MKPRGSDESAGALACNSSRVVCNSRRETLAVELSCNSKITKWRPTSLRALDGAEVGMFTQNRHNAPMNTASSGQSEKRKNGVLSV